MDDDRALVSRYQAGDKTAFDELVGRHSGHAYQVAYGVLGNREDAEEVASDTFIRIQRALPQFRGESEFTTWMYRIALNLARNKYRWNKVRGSQVNVSYNAPLPVNDNGDDERHFDAPDASLPPDQAATLRELEHNLMAELQRLPEVYREALVMRNIQGMSYEEIAEVLDLKLGTVKSRIARAREELRSRLEL